MGSDVWVSVCGVHETDGESEPIRTLSPGSCISEDGEHRINYRESEDEAVQITVSRPFMLGDRKVRRVDLVKSSVRMRFVPGRRQKLHYRTPYGIFSMETATYDVAVEERADLLRVRIRYNLEAGGRRVSACTLTVEITPRGKSGDRT